MNRIIITALILVFPLMATAELVKEGAPAAVKAAPKEHHMQNASTEAAPETAPAAEHTMKNSSPEQSAAPAAPAAPQHKMQNN